MPRPKGSANKNKTIKGREVDAPKKGKSSFFFFLDAKKEEAKLRNPNLQHKELISELSKEWKKLSETEKLPFVLLADEENKRFKKEKGEYEKTKFIREQSQEDTSSKRLSYMSASNEPKILKKHKQCNYFSFSHVNRFG